MTNDQFIKIVEQKIGQAVAEIDGENPHFLPDHIRSFTETADLYLESHGIDTGLTIVADSGIAPDPFDNILGLMLAYVTAASMVDDDLVQKVRSGQMGLSFRTAVSEITTNQAAITLTSSAKRLRSDADRLILLYLSGDPNSRVVRLQ